MARLTRLDHEGSEESVSRDLRIDQILERRGKRGGVIDMSNVVLYESRVSDSLNENTRITWTGNCRYCDGRLSVM